MKSPCSGDTKVELTEKLCISDPLCYTKYDEDCWEIQKNYCLGSSNYSKECHCISDVEKGLTDTEQQLINSGVPKHCVKHACKDISTEIFQPPKNIKNTCPDITINQCNIINNIDEANLSESELQLKSVCAQQGNTPGSGDDDTDIMEFLKENELYVIIGVVLFLIILLVL